MSYANKHDDLVADLTARQAQNIIAGLLDILEQDGKILLGYQHLKALINVAKGK